MVLLTTFPSSVTTPEIKKRVRKCVWSKKTITTCSKHQHYPVDLSCTPFNSARETSFLSFKCFCWLHEAAGGQSFFFTSAELLGKQHNMNLEPPAILISIALYHKCIHSNWRHLENSKCKQSSGWLLQSPGHGGEYSLSVWSDEHCLPRKGVELHIQVEHLGPLNGSER